MADQATINDKSRIGFQVAYNQAAVADQVFADLEIVPDIDGTIRAIESAGEEFPTGVQKGIVKTPIKVTGTMGFVSLPRLLDAMFGHAVPVRQGNGRGWKRTYNCSTTQPRFFTNDYGDVEIRFQRAVDCFIESLHLHATLEETTVDADGTGQQLLDSVIDGLTADPDPDAIAQVTPDPLKSSLYRGSSLAALDTATPFLREFVFDMNLAGRWGTIYAMNHLQNGNASGVIRKKPSAADGMIQVGQDDEGWAYFTRALNNTIEYLRWATYGDILADLTAEVQTVDLSGDDDPTGGVWDLTILGELLADLAWNISAASLQTAIRALDVYGASDVTVSKLAFVYTITFPSYLGNVAAVTTDNGAGLTGGGGDTFAITVLTTVVGGVEIAGVGEAQTVNLSGDDDPTGGVWDLTILGHTITDIAWDVSAAALQSLIRSLVAYGANGVTVGKVGFVYTITFPAYLGNVAAITTDNGVNFTGGGGDTFAITVLTTVPGTDPTRNMIQVNMAVAARSFPKRGTAPSYAEGLDVLDVDLWLMHTADLNGCQIVVVNDDPEF